jgi:hypothetical protein
VVENGVVGRIFLLGAIAPRGRPWMWANGHSAATIKRARHGYEPTREAAMQAFARSWRRRVAVGRFDARQVSVIAITGLGIPMEPAWAKGRLIM